jgi:hypothetical protein
MVRCDPNGPPAGWCTHDEELAGGIPVTDVSGPKKAVL